MASGLNTLGYQLAWPTGMAVREIDQLRVIAFKSTTLTVLGTAPTTDLRAMPIIDLRHD
ncbi:class I SAM-dependent methyltransferase [Mycobacterium uberis]|uniref:class I SAM-dependent methyltransferase n=1 Tax=Mycobacterium uberis TaxID=2162698 RepID=UPI001FB4BD6C|nr:class I SAM-dependent methyltransferase [Mycobacterium uberis]